MDFIEKLTKEFQMAPRYMENIIQLLEDGNTIPFIARYRKEMTGSCDDQVLRQIADRYHYLCNLEERKQEIITAITNLEKMTDELAAEILAAETLARLEDIYRPYKQKKRTRATVAKEKGLEPLAEVIFAQELLEGEPLAVAEPFINAEKGVNNAQEALQGACDIIAERISDDAAGRNIIRNFVQKTGILECKAAKEEDSVYRMYYDYAEPLRKIPSHRILAMNRGEKEGFLKISIAVDQEEAIYRLSEPFVYDGTIFTELMDETVEDAYKRLIFPAIEREFRSLLTEKSAEQAIQVFGTNLKQLLMQPPIRGKVALGFDPAYRTGCKLAVVDETGKVLNVGVVYPTPPQNKVQEAKDLSLIHI